MINALIQLANLNKILKLNNHNFDFILFIVSILFFKPFHLYFYFKLLYKILQHLSIHEQQILGNTVVKDLAH